ncbi:M48 family metallopeptidase [Neopoerus faecalis]|uniref:M48 family metallopeptidase n=1 Tax=Neopoerus faecalis TaxID=3032125 RepID=UPI00256FF4CE|nr:SprT family zinc-dependent metalloprotease [Neopoerus faecalis]
MQCYTALMREYGLLRSRRKTLALELKKDGTLLVRAPMRLAKREIDRFVAAHEDWIEKHLEKLRASPALPEPTPEETEALKAAAWAVLPERVAYWSTVMGVRPAGIKITTAKKRYGSCSSKHSLCFSCYLMRSPMEAVDLVVVHELCHIQEMNHGPRFYALLERYLPDWRERKRLLV